MNKKRKRPILILIILLSLVCVLAITFYSIINLHIANKSIISIYKDRVLPLQQLKNVSDAYTIGIAGSCFQLSLGLISTDSAVRDIKGAQLRGNSNWLAYQATYLTPEEKTRITHTSLIKTSLDSIVGSLLLLLDRPRSPIKQEIHVNEIYSSLIAATVVLNNNLDALVVVQTNEANNLKVLAENIFDKIIFLSIIVIIACFLILMLIIRNQQLQQIIYSQTEELELHKNQLENLVTQRTFELSDSEAKFRGIFENSTDAIVLLKNDIIVDYNAKTMHLFNCHDAYLIGRELSQIVSPIQTEEMGIGLDTKIFFDLALEDANTRFDSVCKRIDGSTFEAEVSVSPLEIRNEILLQVILHDISERKRAEMELIESKLKLSAILESTTDMIWAVEPKQFRLISYNSAFSNYFKFIIGLEIKLGLRPFEILLPENVPMWISSYERVLKEGPYEADYETHNKLKTLHVSFNPIKFEGKTIGISVFGRDITALKRSEKELKKSEERYRIISTLSGNMIYEHFIESDIFISEGAISDVTGYDANEFSCSSFTKWTSCIHLEDRQRVISTYNECIQNVTPFHSEYRIINQEKEYIWIEHEAYIIELKNHSGYKAMGVIKNINQKKMLDNQILNSVIETEEKERMNFSQELHDGLGPLLSASKMYVQWLGKPNPKVEKQEIIEDIEKLLDESHLAVREISFKLSPHILKNYGFFEAVKAYVDKIADKIPGKIYVLENHPRRFNEKMEIIAYRALCECINNGVKHSGASEIKITISCDKTYLHVEYKDNGIGFEVKEVLASHKGIGLLNMQSRLNSVNANLNLQSEINMGSNIKFDINLAEAGFS